MCQGYPSLDILTDENVPNGTVELLRQLGHDVLDIKEQRLYGLPDAQVFQLAVETRRLLLLLNYRDFEDQVRYPASHTGGVIVSRIRPNVAERINPRLKALLISTKREALHGKLTILYHRGWRIGARGTTSRG